MSRLISVLANRTRKTVVFAGLIGCFLWVTAYDGIAHDIAPPEDVDLLTSMVSMQDLSPSLIAFTLILAIALGAIHALSPGHGKALVAAYLVGTRSRARDAILLGVIVTLTHTAGVFVLGIATFLASSWRLLPQNLLPWLSVVSGLIVFGIGAFLLYIRLGQHPNSSPHHGHTPHHHHHHHHHHRPTPPGDDELNSNSLLALGISGGALPCPSALMLLLTAISLKRVAFGLVLLLAFSFGLGAVLTLTGWLFIKARNVVDRFSSAKILSGLPVVSAGVIMILGLAISTKALLAVM
jgi:ABC-type nickel/cobalt efflux system permease component RcnA